MAKSTNILNFISILQFSQMYLIFEINVSKEIKKMIAKDCKRLAKTSMCINLVCILWVWAFLKLLAVTLWSQSCCLRSSVLMCAPSALGDRPGSRPLLLLDVVITMFMDLLKSLTTQRQGPLVRNSARIPTEKRRTPITTRTKFSQHANSKCKHWNSTCFLKNCFVQIFQVKNRIYWIRFLPFYK